MTTGSGDDARDPAEEDTMARMTQDGVAEAKRLLRTARRLRRSVLMNTPVRVSAERLVLAAERRMKTFDRAGWDG